MIRKQIQKYSVRHFTLIILNVRRWILWRKYAYKNVCVCGWYLPPSWHTGRSWRPLGRSVVIMHTNGGCRWCVWHTVCVLMGPWKEYFANISGGMCAGRAGWWTWNNAWWTWNDQTNKKHTEKWVNLHNKIRFTGAYSATTTHIVIIKQSQTNNNEKWIKKKKCILLVIFVRWTGMEGSYNVTHNSLRCTKQKFALYFLIDFIFILCKMFVRFMLLCISIIVIFLAIWHLL